METRKESFYIPMLINRITQLEGEAVEEEEEDTEDEEGATLIHKKEQHSPIKVKTRRRKIDQNLCVFGVIKQSTSRLLS